MVNLEHFRQSIQTILTDKILPNFGDMLVFFFLTATRLEIYEHLRD